MIVYNVTCVVDEQIESDWLEWMLTEHIPEVLSTQHFTESKILKILNLTEEKHEISYAIQYSCNSIEQLTQYREKHGPSLQQKTIVKFGDKFIAFRTVLEEIATLCP